MVMAGFSAVPRAAPDPRTSAPVDAYLTDGKRLIEVLESEWAGVLCVNVANEYSFRIGRVDLAQHWTRVRATDSDPRAD
jgi:hypothetical protein